MSYGKDASARTKIRPVKVFPKQSFIVPEISTFIQTDGDRQICSVIDSDQEYICFTYSETQLILYTLLLYE